MHNHHTHPNHNHDHKTDKVANYSVKDFTPLVVIFTAIVLVTGLIISNMGSYNIFTILRNFMGVFFLVFGTFKTINLRGFANAYQVYDIIAIKSRLYAYLYPFIELALGLAYIFSFRLIITNWITLIIMLVGAYGVYKKLKQKEVVPCACLGVVFKIPMTWVTLGEDLLMASMALIMILAQ